MVSIAEWFGDAGLLDVSNHVYSVVSCTAVRTFEIPLELLRIVLPPVLLQELKNKAKLKLDWLKERRKNINETYSKIYSLSRPQSAKPVQQEILEHQEYFNEIQKKFPTATYPIIQALHDTQLLSSESNPAPVKSHLDVYLSDHVITNTNTPEPLNCESPVKSSKRTSRPHSRTASKHTNFGAITTQDLTFSVSPNPTDHRHHQRQLRPASAISGLQKSDIRPSSVKSTSALFQIRRQSANGGSEIIKDSTPFLIKSEYNLETEPTILVDSLQKSPLRQTRPQTACSMGRLKLTAMSSVLADTTTKIIPEPSVLKVQPDKSSTHVRAFSTFAYSGNPSSLRFLKVSYTPVQKMPSNDTGHKESKFIFESGSKSHKEVTISENKLSLVKYARDRLIKKNDYRKMFMKKPTTENPAQKELPRQTSSAFFTSLKERLSKGLGEKSPIQSTIKRNPETMKYVAQAGQICSPTVLVYRPGKIMEVRFLNKGIF